MKQAKISVAALGGTIAMTQNSAGDGITAQLGAEDLLSKIPELATMADVHAETLFKQSSCSLTFAQLFVALKWAENQVSQGADGVIISQGTDTIEQTAFFFDLFWKCEQPLIVIGAMRGPDSIGFDGLANLLAAVIVARDAGAKNRGVLVVLNDQVHEARWVVKTNTTSLDTFKSPIHGPVAVISENQVSYLRQSRRSKRFSIPADFQKQVLIVEHGLADDAAIIKWAVDSDKAGIVVNAVGSGHVAETMRDALLEAVLTRPVIICSRTGSGSTTQTVYGYKGGEIDLLEHGCLMGGWLPAIKMRLLLLAAVWNNLTKETLKTYLDDWSKGN